MILKSSQMDVSDSEYYNQILELKLFSKNELNDLTRLRLVKRTCC